MPVGVSIFRGREPRNIDTGMNMQPLFERSPDLTKENWRKYAETDNLAVAGLLSQMNYLPPEKVHLKTSFVRAILRIEGASESSALARDMVIYCILTDAEEQQVAEALHKSYPEEAVEYMELMSKNERKGRSEGRVEGITLGEVRGRVEGRVETILDLIQDRFGRAPEVMRASLTRIGDLATLSQITRSVVRAGTLDEVERAILVAATQKDSLIGPSEARKAPSA